MDEELIRKLEQYFRINPSPTGRILSPDPVDKNLRADLLINGKRVRQAAVLIPVIKASETHPNRIMLTVRTPHLRNHAGQVALPGGSTDPGDDGPIDTALRETHEETQLPAKAVQVLGTLPSLTMPSAFQVTPVVGIVEPGHPLIPEPREVAEIFHVPADVLLTPDNYRLNSMPFQGRQRPFMELQHGPYRIWGATAAILHYLAKELADI